MTKRHAPLEHVNTKVPSSFWKKWLSLQLSSQKSQGKCLEPICSHAGILPVLGEIGVAATSGVMAISGFTSELLQLMFPQLLLRDLHHCHLDFHWNQFRSGAKPILPPSPLILQIPIPNLHHGLSFRIWWHCSIQSHWHIIVAQHRDTCRHVLQLHIFNCCITQWCCHTL